MNSVTPDRILHTQAEALEYIDTFIKQRWHDYSPLLELGTSTILRESEVYGHTAWQYNIEGLPVSRDRRERWLLDTGALLDTTLSEDKNTLEKAFTLLFSK